MPTRPGNDQGNPHPALEASEASQCGRVPTILDNRSGNTVLSALELLVPCAVRMDVATGTFEIGSLMALDGLWQDLERIRVLMGDETTRRTRAELVRTVTSDADENIESEKERDDTLTGLPAIRSALEQKQIMARVYARAKFHPKAYILQSLQGQPVDYALVGSSNFTRSGLTRNLELNLFTTDRSHIAELRQWYDEVWQEGELINAELIKIIEPHLRDYTPFEVWAKALYEYFAGRETPLTSWEEQESVVFPMLSKYQQDA